MSEDLRIRLLIVDDEQSIRRLCVTVGEALGFVCLEAASGESALAVLEQEGLVQRRPHPTDGRQVLFALTDQGVAIRRRNTILKRQWVSAAMAKLDPAEQQTLIAAAALFKRLADS